MVKFFLRLLVLTITTLLTGCYTTYTPALYDFTNVAPDCWPRPGVVVTPCLPVSSIYRFPAPLELPNRVFLLVPIAGPLGCEGRAFLNGFFRAYKCSSWFCRPETIIAIDTSCARYITQPYTQAVLSYADFIVGPFSAADVEQLNATDKIPIPTLTLHYLNCQKPAVNLYQFGLQPGWQQCCRTQRQRLAMFYMLGIDAYWAMERLNDMLVQDKVNGVTGCLYLNCYRQVVRSYPCYPYFNGDVISLNEVDMNLNSVDLTNIPPIPVNTQ